MNGRVADLTLFLNMTLAFMLTIFLLPPSSQSIVHADVNHHVRLKISIMDFDNHKFRVDNCSELTASSLYHYSDHFHYNIENVGIRDPADIDYSIDHINKFDLLLSSQHLNPNNETQKPTWYVQEKPSCSNIMLFSLQELKRNKIVILDFRDSRLGEMSLKGGPSQQCLACDSCIDGYLLILTNDELSKSILEHFGFKHVDSMEKYIVRIKNGNR